MSYNRPPVLRPERASRNARPQLWVEGSQRPRFALPAFAWVSVALSRRTALPALIWLAGLGSAAAQTMATNRLGPRLAQAGSLGRALPSRKALATGLSGLAALLSAAADVAVPPPPAATPPAFPDILRPSHPRRAVARLPDPLPAPQLPPRRAPLRLAAPDAVAVPETEFDDRTVHAIRALIHATPEMPLTVPARIVSTDDLPALRLPLTKGDLLIHAVPLHPPEPAPQTVAGMVRSKAFDLGVLAAAWGMTLLVLPIGATRAMILHLNGEDLRTWS